MAPINFGFGRTSRIGKLIKEQIVESSDVPTNGLKVWLKADVGLLDANGNAITSENTNVHTWQDQSGNNLHATQSTTSLQPVVSSVNGVSSVYFSADRLDISSFESSASFTIFSVHKATGHGLVYERSTNTNATNGEYLYTATNYTIATRRNNVLSGYNYPNNSNWGVTNEVKVATHQFDGSHTGHTLRDDGISVDMGAGWGANITSPETINQPLYIGARGAGGAGITGHICEILYYDRVLSAEEVSEIELYLNNKWGGSVSLLTLNLDASDTSSYPGYGTTWYDLSGNNNNVNFSSQPEFNSEGYINFQKSSPNPATLSSGSSVTNLPTGNSSVTIETWIKHGGVDLAGIVGWGSYGIPRKVHALRTYQTDKLVFYGWAEDVYAHANLVEGEWYHIVARYDSDLAVKDIWVNGSFVARRTNCLADVTNSNFTIGKTFNTEYYEGGIAQLKIYNYAISDSDILENYNNTKGTFQDTSLVLHLDASDTSSYPGSGTTWYDLSGYENNATLNSIDYGTNKDGVMVFNATSDYASVSTSSGEVLSNTEYTKCVWVNFDSLSNYNNLLSGGNSAQHAFWTSNTPYLKAGHNNNWGVVTSSTALSTNTWYFAVVTFSTVNGFKIYINGILDASNSSYTTPFTTWAGSEVLQIGRYDTGTNGLLGKIGLVSAYNKELNSDEILELYNNTKSRFETNHDLVLDLDASNTLSYSGTGTTWYDLSGNNNHATLNGSPAWSSSYGGKFTLDNTDDWIDISVETNSESFTFETWFYSDRPETGSNDAGYFFQSDQMTGAAHGPGIAMLEGAAMTIGGYYPMQPGDMYIYTGSTISGSSTVPLNYNFPKNSWTHLTISWNVDSDEVKLYENGVLKSTVSVTATPEDIERMSIFKLSTGSFTGNYLKGDIATVKVYQGVLNIATITDNYNNTKSRFGY